MLNKLVLIDGHSILNRAFYGVPDLTNSEGLHTNAVYGFLNIMFKILEEEQADYLAVAFDLSEPTFRHKQYSEYKGTRKSMPEELREQVPLIKEVLTAMNITILTLPGYEADDILGTIAKREAANGAEVSVVSGDRDLLQLADSHIKIRIPKTSKGKTEVHDYYPEDVKREYQVTPLEFIDVKALMGDASDNIPGVPSIGEKTATNLITAYGSIENVYAHLAEIKPPRAQKAMAEHYDMAQMSKELATIEIQCPIDFSLKDAHLNNMYTKEAFEYMKRLEFKSILARFTEIDRQEETSSLEEVFQLVEQPKQLSQITEQAVKQQTPVGICLVIEKREICGLSLCLSETECYVAFVSADLTAQLMIEAAKEIFVKTKQVVTLNLKEQLPALGLENSPTVFDASVAGYLLNPLKSNYDYDELAKDYLGMLIPTRADLIGKQTIKKAMDADLKQLTVYAGYLGYVSLKSFEILDKQLKETQMDSLFTEIEMPLIYSLYHMEEAGVKVEKEELKEYGDKLKVRIQKSEEEIYELAGETFNINSPKQLGEVLFDHMKLPHGKKTKTGYSTAAEVLEKLAVDYPIVNMILEYRQLSKLNSTYAEGLANYIQQDGRIHGTFNQTITATGRISSTEPNLQNIPIRMELGREIRKVFVPQEDYVFVDADYSQIELRILAHMSGDERLINAYKQAQDIHAITASEVFHTPLEQVTSLQRRNAKAVNFGIVYGISAHGLSEDLSIPRKEALEYINKYFETYPKVKEFLDQLVEQGKEQGYVTTLFGRRRPIPEMKSSNFMQRAFGERVAMNSPIQGTAADIMKIAMIHVDQLLRSKKMKSRIVLQVHDELLIETHKDEVSEVCELLEREMKQAADLSVSLEVETHTGKSWFDAK